MRHLLSRNPSLILQPLRVQRQHPHHRQNNVTIDTNVHSNRMMARLNPVHERPNPGSDVVEHRQHDYSPGIRLLAPLRTWNGECRADQRLRQSNRVAENEQKAGQGEEAEAVGPGCVELEV